MNRYAVLSSIALAPLAFATFPGSGEAQFVCTLGEITAPYNPALDSDPSDHAIEVGKRVAKVLCGGTCGVLMFRNPTAPNALTFVLPTGAARIVYKPQFMNKIDTESGETADFGVIAHEVGHVIDGRTHVSWMLLSWSRELRADAWAGCAIARANLSEKETAKELTVISLYPSPDHPPWNLRVPALDAGYRECGGKRTLPQKGKEW